MQGFDSKNDSLIMSISGIQRGENWQCGFSTLFSKCEAQEEVQKAGWELRGRILPRGWKTGTTEGDRRTGRKQNRVHGVRRVDSIQPG